MPPILSLGGFEAPLLRQEFAKREIQEFATPKRSSQTFRCVRGGEDFINLLCGFSRTQKLPRVAPDLTCYHPRTTIFSRAKEKPCAPNTKTNIGGEP